MNPVHTLDSSRLEDLLEAAQLLNSSLDLDNLLGHLLRTVMGRLLVGRGFVVVQTDGTMRFAQVRGLKNFKPGDIYDETAALAANIHSIYPIGNPENPAGFLGIGKPPAGTIAPEEEQSLKALLGLAASSIANAQAHTNARRFNQQLDEKVQELSALLDLVRGLTSALEPEEVARLLALTLTGRWATSKFALAVQKQGHPTVLRHKGIVLPEDLNLHTLVEDLPEAAFVADLPETEFKEHLISQNASILFRLRPSETAAGILVFGLRMGKLQYKESDLEFGAGLSAQAGVAFENAWHVRETIERKKMEQELELAASIQAGLFPEFLPKIAGYDVAAQNRAALHCGGDYYDVLPIDANGDGKNSFLLCVADVSGKGLPASLLMSNMQATLRALLGRTPTIVELAVRTNELLFASSPSNKFVTAILVELDPETGEANYVNAGHGDCFLLRADKTVERLEATGLPLGMMPPEMLEMLGKQYEQRQLKLNCGDLLALYSDGVTEAYDEHENEWGDERLLQCLNSVETESSKTIVTKVIADIDVFAGTAPQHDDITILVIKRAVEN